MKYFRKKEMASYTVEAAFVVPIVLGLAFVVLYVLFLFHDKVILQANLENLIFLLVEEAIEDSGYENYLSDGLWMLEVEEIAIKNKKTVVKGTAEGRMNLRIPLLNLFMSEKQTVTASEKYYKIQPEEIIRYGPDFVKKRDVAEGG